MSGAGPDNQADLQALATAAHEPELPRRWQQLEQVLDLDRFFSFVAMEVIAGHRDGYCLARNNFRIYHDLDTGKMLFFPHGMDQLFGKSPPTVQPQMSGLVARALLETTEGRGRYRQRLAFLLTNCFDVRTLTRRADVILAQLRPLLSNNESRALEQEVGAVKARIARRRNEMEKQLHEPETKLLQFEHGAARLTAWQMVDPPANGIMEQTSAPDGKPALRIRAGPVTSASWRTKVLLARGRYRFEGLVRTTGIEPLNFGKSNGANLRVLGARSGERGNLMNDQSWRSLRCEFEVAAPEQEVELICELRAQAGEARFDLDSLRLVRLEDASPSGPH